uniref:EGF-like domain-containing protein n=1 Tax=Anser cygnoides TaxID=8845 RepID=A0A8B9EAF2_ANSCY
GGICYMIPTVSSPFCRCIENYTGARCEEVLLPSIKSQTKGDLFAVLLCFRVLKLFNQVEISSGNHVCVVIQHN